MATIDTTAASRADGGRVPETGAPDGATERRGDREESLERDTDDFTRELGDLIRVVQFRDRDRACCHGLSVTQCYALEGVIGDHRLTVNELAAYMYLDKSTVSRVASGLVQRGLVRRETDRDDGRIVRLAATDEGRAVHTAIREDLQREHGTLLEDLTPETRASFVRVLARLRRSFAAGVEAVGGSCCVVE